MILGSFTSIAVNPSFKEVTLGNIFTLDLNVSDVTDLYLWVLTVEWDPSIIEFQGYEEGPFLKSEGPTTIMDAGVSSGKIERLVCTILGPVPGADGEGSLVTFTFNAEALGTTPFSITFSDLLNSNGEHIPHNIYDGIVQVSPPNTPPSAPIVGVTPDSPYTTEDLTCTVTTPSSDTDGDPITYTYQWYKDESLEQTTVTTDLNDTLSSTFTSKGETWKCLVTPNDETVNGLSGQDQVTISNSLPTAPIVDVTPDSSVTTDDLTCTVTTPSTDPDSDTITYAYEWFKNGILQPSETTITTALNDTVPSLKTKRDEVWGCVVIPNDGAVNGSSDEDSVTILNCPPVASNVEITPPIPYATEDLVGSYLYSDVDNDAESGTQIRWYKNDILQPAYDYELTLPASATTKGDVSYFTVRPRDGTHFGDLVESIAVTIQELTSPKHTLTINSSPMEATFAVDGVFHTTPWSEDYSEDTSVSLVMPETHTVGEARYYWYQWSDGVTNHSRTVTMNTNITLTAHFAGPYYELTATSSPTTGIEFTIDGVPQKTPYNEWLLEGSYTLEMPESHNGHAWSYWLEDGETSRTKTIALSAATTWTGVFKEIIDAIPPTANAGSDNTVNEDTPVTLNGSGSWDNVDITTYTWTFIDVIPQTLSGVNPTYNFANPEIYTIVLNVSDAAGNFGTDSVVVTVIDVTPPVAHAGPNQKVDEDTLVTLDGSNSSDNVDIKDYTWTFADAINQTLSGVKPTCTFEMPGTYTITLNVTDATENWATDTVVIEVVDVTNPAAKAGLDQTVNVGTTVTFNANGSNDNVGIASYEWDFGDGTTGTGVTTEHTYPNPGTYTVTLTVKDAAGNTGTQTITITVLRTIPWEWLAVASVVVIILVAAALVIRRRKS